MALNYQRVYYSSDDDDCFFNPDTEMGESPQSIASRKRPYSEFDLNGTQQIVHPCWESLDPTPDIYGLFKSFNMRFFQGKLSCVELEWSKKMYSCAGICYQRKSKYGKACVIRLSEPLLKLRSRKNLIETLLHEMIHAYLFTLNVREGNGGHGPNFRRIMTKINKVAGTNIDVYHTFLNEVNFYKNHIWRCNGICQHRHPFMGFVRRSSNRAPGPNDNWWANHMDKCGGRFLKVSEPDPIEKRRNPKGGTKNINPKSKIDNPKWGFLKKATPDGIGTKLSTINVGKPMWQTHNQNNVTIATADISAGRNLSNVVGFKELNETASSQPQNTKISSSGGHLLGKSPNSLTSTSSTSEPRTQVRDFWKRRYSTIASHKESKSQHSDQNKKPTESSRITSEPLITNWTAIDEDIAIQNIVHETITIDDENLDEAPDAAAIDEQKQLPTKPKFVNEEAIRREIIDSFGDDLTDSDIELIDHDYDDEGEQPNNYLCDKSITDNLFDWNKSTEDLNRIQMLDPENAGNPDKELVSCPVCQIKCERELISDHFDGCLGVTITIDPKRAVKPPKKARTRYQPLQKEKNQLLVSHKWSADADPLRELVTLQQGSTYLVNSEKSEYPAFIPLDLTANKTAHCPVCQDSIKYSEINDHLDVCLST